MGPVQLRCRYRDDLGNGAMSRVDPIFHHGLNHPRHIFSCLPDYGVPVFAGDVASSNYPVFKGPATL